MDKSEAESTVGEVEALLDGYLRAQAVFRQHAPRASVGALMLFTFLARRTFNDGTLNLPSQTEMAKAIEASLSGISHLLATLTPKGRAKAGSSPTSKESGYGLIETMEWIPGLRSFPYVLTPTGRACLEEMVQALTGNREIEIPASYDIDSLVKLFFVKAANQK